MKAHIITLSGVSTSVNAAERCIASAKNISIKKFEAINEKQVETLMKQMQIKWNYPWEGEVLDVSSGLKKSAYTTANPLRRMACFLSHYLLWKKCAEQDETLVVLEHDALFTRPFDETAFSQSKFDIISMNDPRGATRRAGSYHDQLQSNTNVIQRVPTIDDIQVPQGLPGNSAYIIKPKGAKLMIDLTREFGAWPNDALMCKQLVSSLGASRIYYTKTQGTKSTTTL